MAHNGPARVMYVSPVGERGGAETVLLNILKFHDRDAFDPLVCVLKPGPLIDEVNRLGIRTVAIETGRLSHARPTARAIRVLRRLIATHDVDLVFGNMAMGHVYGGLAAFGTRARTVWFQHGIASRSDPLDWIAAAVPSSRIYVNSRATEAALKTFPRCAARTQLLHLGVDGARFAPSHNGHRPLLSALGVPRSSHVVAMVARFQRWKGQDVFIRAAARVNETRGDVHFVLVGDVRFGLETDFKRQLQELVATLKLESRVTFAGFRDDVPALLDEVDIVVHPAVLPEPFGLAVVEALLMEKPVIASDHGGPVEIIADRQTGLLVPPGDPAAIADRILDLVAHPDTREALGRSGRASMLQRFTVERMMRELEDSYREVLSARVH